MAGLVVVNPEAEYEYRIDAGTFRIGGLTKDEVLRLIGPPDHSRSVYFKARDELAWEWRFREIYGNPARFVVLFDASAGRVRGTMILPERDDRRMFRIH